MGLLERWPILTEWKLLFAIIWPLILLPLPIIGKSITANCAYAVAILAGFWMTEAVPIPITSLMPMFLYPILGVQSSDVLAQEYLKDSILIFVGGLLVALAFEYSALHKRIALRVILYTGTSVKMLLLGIMLCTMFLSCWMSNTAVAAMMVPIIMAVLEELERSLTQVYKKEEAKRIKAGEAEDEVNEVEEGVTNEALDLSSEGDENIRVDCQKRRVSFYPGDGECDGHTGKIEISLSPPSSTSTPRNSLGSISSSHTGAPGTGTRKLSTFSINSVDIMDMESSERKGQLQSFIQNIQTMFLLSCCYSANIGGTGVITGSGTNLVAIEFLGNLDPKHHGDYAALTFTTWMTFNIVPMMTNILIAWLYLQLSFIGIPARLKFWRWGRKKAMAMTAEDDGLHELKITPETEVEIKCMLQKAYEDLGSITTHEKGVGICFLLAVASWIFHDPKFIPGWSELFTKRVSISSSALAISILFFVIPRNTEFYQAFKKRDFTNITFKPLLDWSFVQKKFPWGVVILLGGGYAMSNGAKKAGLSKVIGQSLKSFAYLPPSGILAVICVLIAFITEIASNTATATIVLPILLEVSKELNIHPLYLTLPATVVCSYAFMLPVATPPNAIVYAASDMKVTTMIKTGFFMNCACVFTLYLSTVSYGNFIFRFSDYNYVP